MCDPLSAMVGLGLAGTAVSAAGSVMQGNAAYEGGVLQERAYADQAANEQRAASFQQMQERRKAELAAANARAQVGASGVAFTGSPTEALVANAGENELEIQAIQYGADLKSGQLLTQGRIARFSGERAQTAGYIAGASTLLSGAGKAFSPFAPGSSVRLGVSQFA